MTPIVQWKRLDRVAVACTCLLHASHGPLAIAELLLSAVMACMAVGLTGKRMWMGYFCGRLFTAMAATRETAANLTDTSVHYCLFASKCVCVCVCVRACVHILTAVKIVTVTVQKHFPNRMKKKDLQNRYNNMPSVL